MRGKDKTSTINTLKAELIRLKSNAKMRQDWLSNNLDSPRFEEVRRDLSVLQVKVKSREDRLRYLSKRYGNRKSDAIVEPYRVHA